MYTYQILINTAFGTQTIIRSDGLNIPCDPANIDYAAYLAWVAAGNTPEPAEGIS